MSVKPEVPYSHGFRLCCLMLFLIQKWDKKKNSQSNFRGGGGVHLLHPTLVPPLHLLPASCIGASCSFSSVCTYGHTCTPPDRAVSSLWLHIGTSSLTSANTARIKVHRFIFTRSAFKTYNNNNN